MKFSQAVYQLRESLHLSQMAFAKELGVRFTSINRWENEVQKPSALAINMLKAYCREKGLVLEYDEPVKAKEGQS